MKSSDKNAVKTQRTPRGRPFLKGNKGGPGRPQKADTFADIAREMLASTKIELTLTKPDGRLSDFSLTASNTFNYALSVSLIKHGMAGNVAAVKEILDRVNGKVSDKLIVDSDGQVRVTFTEQRTTGHDQPASADTATPP